MIRAIELGVLIGLAVFIGSGVAYMVVVTIGIYLDRRKR